MTEERPDRPIPGRHRRPGSSSGAVALLVCAGFVVCAVVVLRTARRATPTVAARVSVVGVATPGHQVATTTATTGAESAPTDTSPSSTTVASTSTTVDVGALPQTDTEPTTTTPAFTSGSAALWQAVVHDDPDRALPFFFPRSAYRQVKDIADPDADWTNRLVANFRADVHALHQQLGTLPAGTRFERLDVPEAQAQWITPGVEYNKGSYWRVYGSRLLYNAGGEERSLPVTSLISWRGDWYVVHLGAIR